MTTTTPPAPAQQITRTQQQRITLRKLFDQQRPEIAKLLPRNMSPERLERMALTECVKNPKLLECSAESWALAMQTCAAQGLYPDSGLGFMYLIPSNNSKKIGNTWVKVMEVRAQRGYQGDIALARKSGEIDGIYAEVVYEKDEYKVTKGLDRNIVHVPYAGDDDPGALKACYAVAKLRSGEVAWVTLTKRDVDRHRAASKSEDGDDSPWKKHPAAMWRKTAIHELFKWLPKDTEAAERTARAILSDGQPSGQIVDTTAIDLGRVELPAEPTSAGGLDAAADRLESTGGETPAAAPAPGCSHPECPPSKVEEAARRGKTLVCGDCGEELRGEATPAREPGSDDGDDTPAKSAEPEPDPKTPEGNPFMRGAAKAREGKKGGQGRLEE